MRLEILALLKDRCGGKASRSFRVEKPLRTPIHSLGTGNLGGFSRPMRISVVFAEFQVDLS